MSKDAEFMREAIALSRQGFPAPNPHVGCVVVSQGRVVGRGFHDYAGGPHAEAVALAEAGPLAQDSDVYVTLEPCRHVGRTPPCVQALLEAKVARVFIAVLDPNPLAGGGSQILRDAGVEVQVGLLEDEAAAANAAFISAMKRRRPYVVGKAAMSLDGRVALPSGESKWITGESARRAGRLLRAECGAVLVGRNTIVRDEPRLTVRDEGVRNEPVRIILDPNSALTGLEPVFVADAPTLHVVKNPVREGQMKAPMKGDFIDLEAFLGQLFERGLTALLVEGGPITLGHFLEAGLLDRLELFVAPKVLGEGLAWVHHSIQSLDQAAAFKLIESRSLGPDLWLSYLPLDVGNDPIGRSSNE